MQQINSQRVTNYPVRWPYRNSASSPECVSNSRGWFSTFITPPSAELWALASPIHKKKGNFGNLQVSWITADYNLENNTSEEIPSFKPFPPTFIPGIRLEQSMFFILTALLLPCQLFLTAVVTANMLPSLPSACLVCSGGLSVAFL